MLSWDQWGAVGGLIELAAVSRELTWHFSPAPGVCVVSVPRAGGFGVGPGPVGGAGGIGVGGGRAAWREPAYAQSSSALGRQTWRTFRCFPLSPGGLWLCEVTDPTLWVVVKG